MKGILIVILMMITVSTKNSEATNNIDNMKGTILATATYYNAVKSQCAGNPLITADGSRINKSKLRSGKVRWVAVSRDLLGTLKYGTKIYVLSSNKNINGVWEVHDTMNKRYRRRIDFLFHESIETPMIKPEKVLIKKI